MLTFLLSISDECDHDKVIYLYRTFHVDMLKIARSIIPNHSAASFGAEDAVQNAFVTLISHIDEICFDDERRLLAYVATVTQNEARMLLRKEGKHTSRKVGDFEDCGTPIESIPSDEDFVQSLTLQSEYDRVVTAIKQLDDKYRLPLQLYYVEELPVKSIAKLLHMPKNSVYTALRRGKLLLLQKINEKGDFEL